MLLILLTKLWELDRVMAPHTQNSSTLKDGAVVVYLREDVAKPVWQCRIKFADQPYIRRSLKTQNQADAIRKAEKLHDDLRYKHERGLPLRSYRFDQALDRYFDWLEDQAGMEADPDKARRLGKKLIDQRKFSRYIREYFADRPIDRITTGDIEQYKDWRRTYWTKGPGLKAVYVEYVRNGKTVRSKKPPAKLPSASTLGSEDALLRAVFERACRTGILTREYVPEIVTPRSEAGNRFGFSEVELRKILKLGEDRITEKKNNDTSYRRAMLFDFVGLLAFTGMRPFEATKLKWRHIEAFTTREGKSTSKIYVRGKNKERWLIVRDEAHAHVARLTARYYNNAQTERSDEDFVFATQDGTQIKSFKKGLQSLLEAAELRLDVRGKVRDAYSFRHYYATQRLTTGVSVYVLAENMGTSVPVIESNYSHVNPEMVADELTME